MDIFYFTFYYNSFYLVFESYIVILIILLAIFGVIFDHQYVDYDKIVANMNIDNFADITDGTSRE